MTARDIIQRLIAEQCTDLATVSRAIGRNHAYLQQYIKRGSPRILPEDIRMRLAEYFAIDANLLMEKPGYAPYRMPGLAEMPGIPFRHEPIHLTKETRARHVKKQGEVFYLTSEKPTSDKEFALEVRDKSLNLSGFLPGDIAISALDAKCEGARFVVAQHYNPQGGADTLLRAYQTPYLMPHSTDEAFRPLRLDQDDVRLVSPVLRKITLY